MKPKRWSDLQLIEAYNKSKSLRQILSHLDLTPAGGNYSSIKNHLDRLSLKLDALPGKGWRLGTKNPVVKAKSLDQILTTNSTYQSSKLRKRLLDEGIFTHKCDSCKKTKWLRKPIPLELDHINGIKTDNRLENLRLLCANCHAFTPTYRGKNIRGRAGIGIRN